MEAMNVNFVRNLGQRQVPGFAGFFWQVVSKAMHSTYLKNKKIYSSVDSSSMRLLKLKARLHK